LRCRAEREHADCRHQCTALAELPLFLASKRKWKVGSHELLPLLAERVQLSGNRCSFAVQAARCLHGVLPFSAILLSFLRQRCTASLVGFRSRGRVGRTALSIVPCRIPSGDLGGRGIMEIAAGCKQDGTKEKVPHFCVSPCHIVQGPRPDHNKSAYAPTIVQ
jgi:hypothetical protein